ncbi:putative baseplate assembly protein [Actinoplanes lobatus]|uniref:Baseplate assembly protein n=1 Tax=Actinoplanes lobatus TaxID=113568 RepID=A0A7W7HM91_9ACTN|nr:putative baseplate assembly protein [Actinoplanes lobatus]MBB4753118.1 putative phage baseplate assembly protein [Actinoplanes lobatus]GGN58762.1 putative baseplate assembly protein [Actinoplanes lobatus]GIE43022.1 putative baseplate assembly protein [Actinoplanes lobatus]
MVIRLPLPDLDDLRWQTLVDEGRALIPAYAADWTDHNPADPGITLLELFAYLAELDLFTLNRIGPGQLRKLLALAGVAPEPPRPARVVAELTLRAGAAARELPEGTGLAGHDPFGATVPFRTRHPVTVQPGRLATVLTGDLVDVTGRRPMAIFGNDPGEGSAVHLGLDLPGSLPAGSRLSFGVVPADPVEAPPGDRRHHSVRLVWEQLTAGGIWAAVPAEDTTRAFTAEGRVTLRLPWTLTPRGLPDRPGEQLGWLRARIARGRHDVTPALLGLAYNGVEAVQSVPLEATYRGTGGPGQRIALSGGRLVAQTLRVTGDGHQWRIVPDFAASRRADAHACADPAGAVVTFGDGEHGRVPSEGSALLVAVEVTAAERGNLGAGAVTVVTDDADVTARNVTPAVGGRAAQTIDEAAAAARRERAAPNRAVTLDDHVALALATPGAQPVRAQAFANRHPAFGCLTAPGVVTVVVLPSLPRERPAPTAGLLRAVRAHLETRRIVGTRIEVAAPTFTQVSVRATVTARADVPGDGLPRSVSTALDAFFDPLTGGPDGAGWPFGRDVYRAEILAVVDRVPGVAHVLALELVSQGATCGDVCVGPTGLVASGPHEIDVR